MKKKIICVVTSVIFLLSCFGVAFGLNKNSIYVSVPSFKVIMNGQIIDNEYNMYPLIVYNNITYFPMTYSGSRFLGIESEWKGNKEGLVIEKTGVTAAYNAYKKSTKNMKSYSARIASFPIKVNGKAIDNSKEKYPLLFFRDIIYFPMTWNYSVNEFGWKYNFDNKTGLVVNSDNIKLSQVTISKNRPKQLDGKYKGQLSDCVAIANGYVYYDTVDGRIIQSPISNVSKEKEVYRLEEWSYGAGEYVYHNLNKLDGKMMLSFHQGGAVMGADYKIELNADGTANEIQSSYFQTTAIGDRKFSYYTGQMAGLGNLFMQEANKEQVQIGSLDYQYYSLTNDTVGGIKDFLLIGDELYVKAAKVTGNQAIYKVNIKTNETNRVSKNDSKTSQIEGEYIYYLSANKVYRVPLNSGNEELLGTLTGISDLNYDSCFAVMGGKIYWKNESDMQLYTLNKNESLNPGAKLDGMGISGSNSEYLVCTFEETPSSKYRIMVFDKNGNIVFKTSDKSYAKNITIEGNIIYFYNISSGTVCSGKLK